MTYSFAILGGDLALGGPGGLATVAGTGKLLQDLRCRLLEPVGTDPVNPTYGSTLDGGIDAAGAQIVSNIGSMLAPEVMLEIEAEVIRCLQVQQKEQIARIKREQQDFGGQTYVTSDEILYQIVSVESTQVRDTLIVKVVIGTGGGQTIQVIQPVGTIN